MNERGGDGDLEESEGFRSLLWMRNQAVAPWFVVDKKEVGQLAENVKEEESRERRKGSNWKGMLKRSGPGRRRFTG
ncbi:hypothetical protein Krac_1385 [Ktedonobacter racemifer DSM 44963]|uniref:Uncharacterized protein n=1 Tax=Ktedonobacter racemifer DSM 44963 TaxID=485913 RepID=D6U1B4_KTERA|nr:hypothetical protein Krac_0139 [Ktedonobacter racemifer DSM 44963]EFH80765.1 hypothetical protein Krac_1385 [Ktedonobacter racemifer DSM 44963]